MSGQLRYSMVFRWSDEDRAYVVTLPEWGDQVFNPVTHGETYEEAVRIGRQALDARVASATKRGEPLPPPSVAALVMPST